MMGFWVSLARFPWEAFAWTTGLKAREATEAYQAAKGRIETGFNASSKAQHRAIEALDPDLPRLKRIAMKRWVGTALIQVCLFAAIVGLAMQQD